MKLTMDGRQIVCRSGASLLEAARGAGIPIPSLCDRPGLEPFAGCRICLVEVSGRTDPVPACATPAEEGMAVRTRTPEIVSLRKKVLELILAEHPYACLVCAEKPTCDDLKSTIRKAGEVTGCVLCPVNGDCELQKVALEVGLDRVELPAVYRDQDVRREDPFFDRDYNLCILCGRCIRVCEEVRGASVLSFIHRGGRTEVGTAFDRPLIDSGCFFCGACVDVCPTGALVERAVRPQRRPERKEEIICPFCGDGCVLDLSIRDGKILSARPSDAPPNFGQACVKGRFLVRGAVHGAGRILEPHVRTGGRLVPVTFDEAIERAAAGLQAAAAGRRALIYPSQVPLEDAFLFLEFGQKVMKADAAAAEPAASIWPALDAFAAGRGARIPTGPPLAAIEECGAILAWDVDLQVDHPIAWMKVVRAVRRGAGLVAAGMVPRGPVGRMGVALELESDPAAAAAGLAAALHGTVAAPAIEDGFEDIRKALESRGAASRGSRPAFRSAARLLASGKPAVILFDATGVSGPSGGETLSWLWTMALLAGARLLPLGRGANGRGVHELERALGYPLPGMDSEAIRAGLAAAAFDFLYLAGPGPDLGGRKPPFLVCQGTHWGPNAERADVVLPAAAFAETGGTWVNTEGRVRTCAPALPLPGAARPDGAIIAELARRMGRPELVRPDAAAVLGEVIARVPALAGYGPAESAAGTFFLREPSPGRPRFVPDVRWAGRPAPEAAAARHEDDLRGLDLIASSRGYARIRRAG